MSGSSACRRGGCGAPGIGRAASLYEFRGEYVVPWGGMMKLDNFLTRMLTDLVSAVGERRSVGGDFSGGCVGEISCDPEAGWHARDREGLASREPFDAILIDAILMFQLILKSY
jgi:hypothetical protein